MTRKIFVWVGIYLCWICDTTGNLSKWLSRSKRIKPPMVKGEGICRIGRFTAERDISYDRKAHLRPLFKYTSVDCEGEITEREVYEALNKFGSGKT